MRNVLVPATTEPPDAAILLSVPGIGTEVLATLLADGSDAVGRRDYDALRCLCGVAPVTRSGKSLIVTRRRAAHNRLRDAAYHWAGVAAQRDPVSHGKYRLLRVRGHEHARALRSVADRLLNVACTMLRDGTRFDPKNVLWFHTNAGHENRRIVAAGIDNADASGTESDSKTQKSWPDPSKTQKS